MFTPRKALYGTTALVAAGLASAHATAATSLKLGIGGFYRGAIGVEFGDSNQFGPPPPNSGDGNWGRGNVAFRQEIRVDFTGSTTLDNGITIEVLVALRGDGNNEVASNTTAGINRAYVDFKGKFGEIRFGDADSAYVSYCVGDPGNVTANFGLNSPNESFSNAGQGIRSGVPSVFMPTAVTGAGTCFGLETRSTKLVYFSPTFGGFNLAVSFTPDQVRSAGGSGGIGGTFGVGNPVGAGPGFHDILSVGINFDHDFGGGVTLLAGVSGEWAFAGKTTSADNANDLSNKPSMYQAGFQLGFGGGWALGASGQYVVNFTNAGYGSTSGAATPTDDAYMITAGGSYTTDAFAIGFEGLYDHYALDGLGTVPGGNSEKYHGVSLNGSYTLGPGVALEGQFAWTKSATDMPGIFQAGNVNSYEFDVGTAINF